jgi:hypothetical protein
MERAIGAGILVEERRKTAPLAAHPPCWKGISLSGGSTAQSKERDRNLAVLPQKKCAAIDRSSGDVGGFVALIRKQGERSPFGVHRVAGNWGSSGRGCAGLVSSEVAAIGVVKNAGLPRE